MRYAPDELHVYTLLSVYQYIALLLALVMLGGAWQARGRYGLWFWVGSFFAISFSQEAKVLLSSIIGDANAVLIGHLGALIASTLFVLGTRIYLGVPLRLGIISLITIVAGITSICLIKFGTALWPSLSFMLATSALLHCFSLSALYLEYKREGGFPLLFGSLVSLLTVIISASRAYAVIPSIAGSKSLAYQANAAWIMIFILLLVSHGLSIFLLISDALRREILALAEYDALTGLLNRRGLQNRFARIASRSKLDQTPQQISLAMIDIDYFKNINDQYGHAVGDEILVQTGQKLMQELRPNDISARLGGEEFIVIWTSEQAAQAMDLAERLRAKFEQHEFSTRAGKLRLTISIGVSKMQQNLEDLEDLDAVMNRADSALYQAKHKGRNQVILQT